MSGYGVWICEQSGCGHPGGQHLLGGGCRLCDVCPGWDNDKVRWGRWSDDQQRAAEAARQTSR